MKLKFQNERENEHVEVKVGSRQSLSSKANWIILLKQ